MPREPQKADAGPKTNTARPERDNEVKPRRRKIVQPSLVPSAGAALLADVDPALDTESETKQSLDRATGRDRMTGES